MSALIIPIVLSFAGLLLAVATYQSIRRGGARFYTLEREAVLRRAALTLLGSTLLFIAAVGYMASQELQSQAVEAEADAVLEGEITVTPTVELGVFPPTPSPTPTVDAAIPTATPTAILCRAIVEGTSGNGLTLRETPGGADIGILAEATFVTLIQDEPAQEANGITWRKVRDNISGDEGWVAEDYLSLGPGCE
ncbi:MAG: SH3 domain-containing protein [Ardenticatenaceae bacterium]|nr:SH3 domain-containing protein [Ardenticatenaceae bacterium]